MHLLYKWGILLPTPHHAELDSGVAVSRHRRKEYPSDFGCQKRLYPLALDHLC